VTRSWGALPSLDVIDNSAEKSPMLTGVNRTSTVQLSPAASIVPQLPFVPGNMPPAYENGAPSVAKLIAETGPPPMLLTMKTRSPELPRPTLPKSLTRPSLWSDFSPIRTRPKLVPAPRTTRVAENGLAVASW